MNLMFILLIFAGINRMEAANMTYAAVYYNHQRELAMPIQQENFLVDKFMKMMLNKYPDLVDDSVAAVIYETVSADYNASDNYTKDDNLNKSVMYHSFEEPNVNLLSNILNCPAYGYAMRKYYKSPKYINTLKSFKPLIANISIELGYKISNFNDIENLHTGFKFLMNNNQTPSSMESVNPDVFHQAAGYSKAIPTDSINLARLRAGPILDDLFSRFAEVNKSMTDVKMDLYRTDDRGIVSILNSLNLYDNRCPSDFATIFIELYKNDYSNESFVKIYYRNDVVVDKVKILDVPACNKVNCTLNEFKALYKKVIPDNWTEECKEVPSPVYYPLNILIFGIICYLIIALLAAMSLYAHVFRLFRPKRQSSGAELIEIQTTQCEELIDINIVTQISNEMPK